MTRIGVPVPPGFSVTTQACNFYLRAGGFPPGMWEQELAALKELERLAGKNKMVSEGNRSCIVPVGGQVFYAGMMDTVLDTRPERRVAAGLIALTHDDRFVYDAYRRLVQMIRLRGHGRA